MINVTAQYIKDLSFEIPDAPAVFAIPGLQPGANVEVHVTAQEIDAERRTFEVLLTIRVDAVDAVDARTPTTSKRLFHVELAYGGVFEIASVDADAIEETLLAECPVLLFPYARTIVGNAIRNGGFPPALLNPIDFRALWVSRRTQGAHMGLAAGNA